MPDTYTHYSISRILSRNNAYTVEFLLGSQLPDVFGRIPWYFTKENIYWRTVPTHSVLPIVFICYLITFTFSNEEERFGIFKALLSGSLLHVIIDLMQIQFGSRVYYYVLFPFSKCHFEVPLFKHVDDSLYLIPLFLTINILRLIKKKYNYY